MPQWRVDLDAGIHHLVADEPTSLAGGNAGASPFGLLLCGLAACTTMTLRMYAARKGWQLPAIEVDVVYNVDADKRGSILRTITVPPDLPEDQRSRLAEVGERTPVTLVIVSGTPITTTMRPFDTPRFRSDG